MIDERMCAACGHVEYWHGEGSVPLPHPKSGPACARCMGQNDVDPWHDFSPPEAAPSTDEGEALRALAEKFVTIRLPVSEWAELLAPYRAAIRAPLEERIRDLQRWAEIDHANLEATEERIRELEADIAALEATTGYALAEQWKRDYGTVFAENDRLREALRAISDEDTWGSGDWKDVAWYLHNLAERALATPPSSTEGTKEGGE